jgi:hypothetical protein
MDYLVYNDQTGEFVTAEAIIAVIACASGNGAWITVRGYPENLFSPLKPRELLRRLTIMRFKRKNDTSTEASDRSRSTL